MDRQCLSFQLYPDCGPDSQALLSLIMLIYLPWPRGSREHTWHWMLTQGDECRTCDPLCPDVCGCYRVFSSRHVPVYHAFSVSAYRGIFGQRVPHRRNTQNFHSFVGKMNMNTPNTARVIILHWGSLIQVSSYRWKRSVEFDESDLSSQAVMLEDGVTVQYTVDVPLQYTKHSWFQKRCEEDSTLPTIHGVES